MFAGITDKKMLDWFVLELKPVAQYEVIKDSPSTFLDACMLANRIYRLDNYLMEMHSFENVYQ